MAAAVIKERAAEVAAEEAGAPKPADEPKNGEVERVVDPRGRRRRSSSSFSCCDCAPGAAGWRRAPRGHRDLRLVWEWLDRARDPQHDGMCCLYAGQTEAWAALRGRPR